MSPTNSPNPSSKSSIKSLSSTSQKATNIPKLKMCIHYTVEFWTPNPNPNADIERRALRGILAPGQNRAARQREFWLHDCDFLSSPRCRGADIREGGVFYGRVFEFCFDDADCRARLEQFETEYEHYRREVRRSEQRREPEARQKWLGEQLLRAYYDWVSVYENHKDCPQTRSRHEHFRALRVANVCIGGFGLPDRLRLGRNPNSLPIPTVEVQRTRTPTPMRR